MRGRLPSLLAGIALATGGGIAGAVVVAPTLAGDEEAEVVRYAEASKQERATPKHVWHVAMKARGMARGARQIVNGLISQVDQAIATATSALDRAQTAQGTADASKVAADAAKAAADATSSRLDTTRLATARTNGSVSTTSSTYVTLGGPSVTVNVPQSGLIEVWASVHIDDVEGAVGLFEDGQLVQLGDQAGGSACGVDDAILGTTGLGPISLSTPPTLDPLGEACGVIGDAPGSILLERTQGTHTYELRYADCGCFGGGSTFSERIIRVAPRL